MTREQMIVLGFIAAAFAAGWLTSALTSALIRPRHRDPAAVTGSPAAAPLEPPGDRSRRLAEEVGDALRSDVANERMLSVLAGGGDPALTELELDLADWGFTYGVAWARAREQEPDHDHAAAGAALRAAEQVFGVYTGDADWRQRLDERSPG